MSNAIVLISNITLASTSATVNFFNIPNTYKDLILVCNMTSGNGGNGVAALRYNSDTGTNYWNVGMYGDQSGTGSYANNVSYQYLSSTAIQTTNQTLAKVEILDYAQTDRHKLLVGKTGLTAGTYANIMPVSSRWASNAAITSLNIFQNGSGTFNTGDTFMLYGVLG